MLYERRAILSLIAAGRITAAEAERLLLAWHQAREWAREWVWISALCLAVCFVQTHPHIRLQGLGNLLHTAVAHGTQALHTATSIGLKRMGGNL
jgi:hypothetical protein